MFKKLKELLGNKDATISMTISIVGDEMTLLIKPKDLPSLSVRGTAEEIEEKFDEVVITALQEGVELQHTLNEFREALEKQRKSEEAKLKNSTAKASATKKATPKPSSVIRNKTIDQKPASEEQAESETEQTEEMAQQSMFE